jgi:hypothetical protein
MEEISAMPIPFLRGLPALALALAASQTVLAGPADVVGVKVTKSGPPGLYSFAVTVRHDDTGWEHYADAWEVVGPDGKVLGTRVLAHPHVREQPFTRRLTGVAVPRDAAKVRLRAHDKLHGLGGREVVVDLPR